MYILLCARIQNAQRTYLPKAALVSMNANPFYYASSIPFSFLTYLYYSKSVLFPISINASSISVALKWCSVKQSIQLVIFKKLSISVTSYTKTIPEAFLKYVVQIDRCLSYPKVSQISIFMFPSVTPMLLGNLS